MSANDESSQDRLLNGYQLLLVTRSLQRDNSTEYHRLPFPRVPFRLIRSPFLLVGTIQFHLSNFKIPLERKILRNTYVDKVFHGVSSVAEGEQFSRDSKSLSQLAGMNLRDYASNNLELKSFFRQQESSNVDK